MNLKETQIGPRRINDALLSLMIIRLEMVWLKYVAAAVKFDGVVDDRAWPRPDADLLEEFWFFLDYKYER